jgi:AP-2 complex subunit alpha
LLDPICREATVVVGAYVLGEYGHLIANDPNSSPLKQLALLQSHYPLMSANTRALLLTSYVKLANLFPEIKGNILEV